MEWKEHTSHCYIIRIWSLFARAVNGRYWAMAPFEWYWKWVLNQEVGNNMFSVWLSSVSFSIIRKHLSKQQCARMTWSFRCSGQRWPSFRKTTTCSGSFTQTCHARPTMSRSGFCIVSNNDRIKLSLYSAVLFTINSRYWRSHLPMKWFSL